MGELRRIAELLPEVLGELVVVEDAKCILAVPAGHVRAWIRQDRERWAAAIRRGKTLRRRLSTARRCGEQGGSTAPTGDLEHAGTEVVEAKPMEADHE